MESLSNEETSEISSQDIEEPNHSASNQKSTNRLLLYLQSFFRREDKDISIEDKINFTAFIINNRHILIDFEDFYEEECQLAIINWVVDDRKQLEDESNHLSKALLYNLIIILEIYPVKTKDFITFKLLEKLKSIKRSIKNSHFDCAVRIQRMIAFWKESFNEMVQRVNNEQFLNRKTARDKAERNDDNDNDSDKRGWANQEKGNENECIEESEGGYSSLLLSFDKKREGTALRRNTTNDKKVKWKEIIVEEIEYAIEN